MNRAAGLSIAEIVSVVGMIAAYLWFGRQASPGVNLAFAAGLLAILLYSHRQAGEGWRAIGFRWDTFWSTCRLLLPVMFAGCVLTWSAAIILRESGLPPPARTGSPLLAQFVAFGIAQQYVMLGFIFKRVEHIGGLQGAPLITALLFALLHLPNVFLTTVTFVWGLVCCLVYRRSPNLWANGLAHGLLSANLYYVLPRVLTHGLRVGMEYVAGL
ncbi:MAG TPA: CPBP family intramembrane glutamic endopeptidase [Steroidobacteraceae bacterium]|jgi:membrane protease YdiL (CAAX protease family)